MHLLNVIYQMIVAPINVICQIIFESLNVICRIKFCTNHKSFLGISPLHWFAVCHVTITLSANYFIYNSHIWTSFTGRNKGTSGIIWKACRFNQTKIVSTSRHSSLVVWRSTNAGKLKVWKLKKETIQGFYCNRWKIVARPGLEPRAFRWQCEHSTTELRSHPVISPTILHLKPTPVTLITIEKTNIDLYSSITILCSSV